MPLMASAPPWYGKPTATPLELVLLVDGDRVLSGGSSSGLAKAAGGGGGGVNGGRRDAGGDEIGLKRRPCRRLSHSFYDGLSFRAAFEQIKLTNERPAGGNTIKGIFYYTISYVGILQMAGTSKHSTYSLLAIKMHKLDCHLLLNFPLRCSPPR